MDVKYKKIIITFFGIILFFIFFLVFFVFILKNDFSKSAPKEEPKASMAELFSLAVSSKDEAQCQRLPDQSQVPYCLSEIKDVKLYDAAVSGRDIKICNGIVGQSRKDACLSVVDQLLGYPNADSTPATDLSNTSDEFKP
jgi:hypothetical protein